MPQKIIRGAGYIRISDIKQEKNYSVSFQREKIIAYFREKGIHIKEEHIFVDTYTGKVWRQRKNLQDCLAAAKRHEFDVLALYKLDRLSREPDDQIPGRRNRPQGLCLESKNRAAGYHSTHARWPAPARQ